MKHPGPAPTKAGAESVGRGDPGLTSRWRRSPSKRLMGAAVSRAQGFSQSFESFIVVSSQADTQFLMPYRCPARCCVGESPEARRSLKGVFMPNLQSDDFALIAGRVAGNAWPRARRTSRLPTVHHRVIQARESNAARTSAVIDARFETAHTIMFRLFRGAVHQGQNVSCRRPPLPVAQAQGPAIEDQLGALAS